MANVVKVKSYSSRLEAEIDKNVLESHGIPSFINADDVGGMRPDLLMATGGAHLLVNSKDAKKASELLDSEEKE